MQTELFDYNQSLSKQIRDYSYKQVIQKEDTNIQRNTIRHILLGHPEGITDLEICVLTGFSRSSVTAHRNEIPAVAAVGYAKIIDEQGDRLNTLWSIVS